MNEYMNWRQRLEAADGVLPDRVRATRSATEENAVEKRELQAAEMDALWGKLDPRWCWHEVASGHTLARPVLADLLAFCEANPRPLDAPGWVEWSSPDRLGRFADEAGRPDIFQFLGIYLRFKDSGWIPRFAFVQGSGVDPVDFVLHAYGSAQVSRARDEEIG